MPDLLRERLQSSLGSAYTLERELGGGGLDRAYEERSAWLAYAAVEPRLDPLRGDDRFVALMQALRLPARVVPSCC